MDGELNTVPLFKGIILNITIKAVMGVYYLEAEAISNTYNMDVKLNSRSFQNKDMTYKALVENVISSYAGADSIHMVPDDKGIEKLIVQYNETDWEFLMRMASRFNTSLVTDATATSPKFWFGIPEGINKGKLEDFNYSVSKRISDFRNSSENFIDGIAEDDFIYYEVETDKILDIGNEVEF